MYGNKLTRLENKIKEVKSILRMCFKIHIIKLGICGGK